MDVKRSQWNHQCPQITFISKSVMPSLTNKQVSDHDFYTEKPALQYVPISAFTPTEPLLPSMSANTMSANLTTWNAKSIL